MASSGHPRRCGVGYTSNQCLSRDKDASILSWPTIMGHQKLWIAILTAWDTIWPSKRYVLRLRSQMASSGHLRRCSVGYTSNQCLNRDKDASILSWPTVMGHHKLWIAILTAWDTIWPSTKELDATQMASSGHLRRCGVGYTSNQCLSRDKDASILSWQTIMGH
eukprot:scaffold7494_cov90-Skeletonema_dohrnii-CCMP3373.AAC.2